MATIENFILKFKVEGANAIGGLKDDLKDLAANANPLAGTFSNLSGSMGLMATGALAAAGAFAALGMKAINLADEIQDMADATGIGADQLLSLRSSMLEAGGNSESMSKAVSRLSVAIGESLTGNDKYQKSFKDLGVTLRDASGQTRDAGDVLTDTLDALRNIEDPTVRAAKAVELFGKEAAKLDLSKLSAPKDLASKEQIAALATYRGEIDKLKNSIDTALISAFGKLAIAINNIDWTKQKSQVADYLKTLGAALPMLKIAGIGLEASAAQGQQAALMAPYRSRAGVGRETAAPAGGDQGPLSEAKLKAQAESALRTQKSLNESRKQAELATANDIQKIEIAAQYEAQSARAEILAKGRELGLNFAAEAAAKEKEIYAKRDNDIARARQQLTVKIATEEMAQAEQTAKEMAAYYQQVDQARLSAFDQVKSIKDQTEQLQGRFDLQQRIVGLSTIEQQRVTELFDLEQQRKQQLEAIARIKDLPYDERLAREKELNAEFEKRIGLINQEAAVRRARDQDFAAGVEESMKKYAESMTPLKQGAAMADSVYNNMGSSLDRFVETGKFKFGDFANSVIMDLLKIQLRAAATQLFNSVLGTFGFSLPGRALGGPVTAGQPYIVGERGPEVFLPASNGNIVPNNRLGSGGGQALGGSTTIINNISAVDAKSVAQLFAENRMTLFGTVEQARRELPMRTR